MWFVDWVALQLWLQEGRTLVERKSETGVREGRKRSSVADVPDLCVACMYYIPGDSVFYSSTQNTAH
jgi:hypothetical protein